MYFGILLQNKNTTPGQPDCQFALLPVSFFPFFFQVTMSKILSYVKKLVFLILLLIPIDNLIWNDGHFQVPNDKNTNTWKIILCIFYRKGGFINFGQYRGNILIVRCFQGQVYACYLSLREVHGLGQEMLFRPVFPQRSKYFDMFKKEKMFELFKIEVIQ